ncbi:hypothetical protein AALP_AAs58598U000100, partial [Arabis alpina]
YSPPPVYKSPPPPVKYYSLPRFTSLLLLRSTFTNPPLLHTTTRVLNRLLMELTTIHKITKNRLVIE